MEATTTTLSLASRLVPWAPTIQAVASVVSLLVLGIPAFLLWRATRKLTEATSELVGASDAQYQAGVLRDAAAEFRRGDYFVRFWRGDMVLRRMREEAGHKKVVLHVKATTDEIVAEDWGPDGPGGPQWSGKTAGRTAVQVAPNEFLGFYYLVFPLASGIDADLIVKAMSLQLVHAFRDHLRLVHAMRKLTKTEGAAYLPQAYGLEDAEFLNLYKRLWTYVKAQERLPHDQEEDYQRAADIVDEWLAALPGLATQDDRNRFWNDQLGGL